jgi:hypothetical protein
MKEFDSFVEGVERLRKEKNILIPEARDIVKKNKAGLEYLLARYVAEIRFKTVDSEWKYVVASSNPYLINHFDPNNKIEFKNTKSTFFVRTWDFIKNGYCTINLKCWEWGRCLKIEKENFDDINATLRTISSMRKADRNIGDRLDRKNGKRA